MSMKQMRMITCNYPTLWIADIAELIRQKQYPNRSELLRNALRDLLKAELWPEQRANHEAMNPHNLMSHQVIVRMSDGLFRKLTQELERGRFKNYSHAINHIVTEYYQRRENHD